MARLSDPRLAAKKSARDNHLEDIFVKATNHAIDRRSKVIGEIDFRREQSEIRRLRQNATDRNRELYDEFVRVVQGKNIDVLFAKDAKEAKKLIIDVAKRHSCKSVIKSKSMTSEEIGLREAMIEQGMDVVETDLGEFLVQLKGDRPSHLTAPAVHMTARDVGDLLSQHGISKAVEPVGMAQDVRVWMRERFLSADMGIVGANAVAARDGAFLLMSNEGNIYLTSSLPDVLVILMGMDKLVEKIEDFVHLVRVIPKNATGQRITNYVHVLRRPRPGQKVYVVVLDNGRSNRVEYLKEALWCVRCAACMNVCPVFRTIGGHAYGSVYPGPMGIIVTNALKLYEDAYKMADLCTLCGACKDVCAAGIDIPELILRIRQNRPVSFWERMASRIAGWIYSSKSRFYWVFEILRGLWRFMAPVYRLGWRLVGWRGRRDVPDIAPERFDDYFKRLNDG